MNTEPENKKPLSAEDWLNKNALPGDFDVLLKDNLSDLLWTINVFLYMERYAEYIKNFK